MAEVEMIALRKFPLANANGNFARMQPGNTFFALPEQVEYLVASGKAKPVEAKPVAPLKNKKGDE